MNLPSWSDLTQQQKSALDVPLDKDLFVAGPPGSGKTLLALWRARMHAKHPGGCCVVTYNRMLRRRIELLDRGKQNRRDPNRAVVVRTMDQFVGGVLPDNLAAHPSQLNDADAPIRQLLGSDLPRKWGHIVVDEGQDLPEWFFRYASRIGGSLTVFADDDQTLRGDGSSLEAIKEAGGLPNPMLLRENHRNTPEIVRVAEFFHVGGRLPPAEATRSPGEHMPRLFRRNGQAEAADLIARWVRNRGGTVGVIANGLQAVEAFRNALAERLPNMRVEAYTSKKPNEDEIDVTAPGVTILDVRSAKGQEFQTVFITGLEQFVPCSSDRERRWMYMTCTRACDHLFLVQHRPQTLDQVERALPGTEVLRRP